MTGGAEEFWHIYPGEHSTQNSDPSRENVPGGHGNELLLLIQLKPAGHSAHVDDALNGEKYPIGHRAQSDIEEAAREDEYVPDGHDCGMRSWEQKYPGGQELQALCPESENVPSEHKILESPFV